ncbi:hypothetical protein CC1G_13583 [Coprinopsis cinerea okayama7|uniref:Uncharacterized protein n=1 Tax=Coprinopsis cinerea (strain Okayama-7 / 130 / ATCC MYA-4618 / FGSC 9003) TaxID=240176 RepID=D6RJS5_COPC7|nr:hypothetical protein CC1G_13583 [Coprinopsis cinerea okayama7\|eukprot:XP_002912055.1 hypothetical protein CC1G_13583 [Coprinopsis cinerea okayama7\
MEKLQIGRDLRDGLQIHVRYNADGEEEPAPTLCDGILEGGAPRLHHLEIRQCIPSWISAPFNCALKTLKLSLPDVPGNPSDLEIILDTLQDLPLLQCFELTLDEGDSALYDWEEDQGRAVGIVLDNLEDFMYRGPAELCLGLLRNLVLPTSPPPLTRFHCTYLYADRPQILASLFAEIAPATISVFGGRTREMYMHRRLCHPITFTGWAQDPDGQGRAMTFDWNFYDRMAGRQPWRMGRCGRAKAGDERMEIAEDFRQIVLSLLPLFDIRSLQVDVESLSEDEWTRLGSLASLTAIQFGAGVASQFFDKLGGDPVLREILEKGKDEKEGGHSDSEESAKPMFSTIQTITLDDVVVAEEEEELEDDLQFYTTVPRERVKSVLKARQEAGWELPKLVLSKCQGLTEQDIDSLKEAAGEVVL